MCYNASQYECKIRQKVQQGSDTVAVFYENRKMQVQIWRNSVLSEKPHLHDHVEIVCLLEGEHYAMCDGRRERLEPGDFFIAFPNQVHYYPRGDLAGTKLHVVMIFSPAVCSEFKSFFRTYLPRENVLRVSDQPPGLRQMVTDICLANKSSSPFKEPMVRGYLIALLGKLFSAMEFERADGEGELLRRILLYCNQHFMQPLSLDALSRALCVGKSCISHTMRAKTGLTLPAYLNGLRINEAVRRLVEQPEQSITAVAYDCGFESPRTFNRVFAQLVGMSPRAYREKHKCGGTQPVGFYVRP